MDFSGRAAIQRAMKPVSISAADECPVVERLAEKTQRRADAADAVLAEGREQLGDHLLAGCGPGRQLGYQRIVLERNLPTFVRARIEPNAGAGRLLKGGNPARRGHKPGVGVFGIDTALHGVPARVNVSLRIAKLLAGRYPDLLANQVDAGDEFRDRMLDLQPRVHLQKVEIAVGIHQKLDGPRVGVSAGTRGFYGRCAQDRAHCRIRLDQRRRSLFNHFLVASLQAAFAFAQVDRVPVLVGQNLHLDMPRPDDCLFDIDGFVAECLPRLGFRLF